MSLQVLKLLFRQIFVEKHEQTVVLAFCPSLLCFCVFSCFIFQLHSNFIRAIRFFFFLFLCCVFPLPCRALHLGCAGTDEYRAALGGRGSGEKIPKNNVSDV